MTLCKGLRRKMAVLVIFVATVPALAQDTRGRVQGFISDPTGAAVPGASVTLRNDATGIAFTRESGGGGRYLFDQVDPGIYTLTTASTGFSTVVQQNVRVQQRGDVTVDIALRVSDVAETVTVEASPIAVEFNTAARSTSLEGALISELPLISRNPAALAILDPTVDGAFDRQGIIDHYAANAYDLGGRTQGRNEILIDGSPVANSSKVGYNPPVEAVSEYAVRQNAIDAEFGHSGGGVVTMSMKSGTNDLHGSLYYFGGRPGWNAVRNRVQRTHSESTTWNAGGTVSLPIMRNKLFLFTSFERQVEPSPQTLQHTFPTDLEKAGDFSRSLWTNGAQRVIYDPMTSRLEGGRVVRDPFAGNRIPLARLDPVAKVILDNVWAPNRAGDNLTGLNNYKVDHMRIYPYWNLSNRADWQVNDAWRVFGRVSLFRTNQYAEDYTNGTDTLKMRRTEGSLRHGLNITGDTIYTFSPSTALTIRGAFYKTEDKRFYPEMDIGEDGYAKLWPSKWWQPYVGDRPILYFPNFQIPSGDTFGVRNFWFQEPNGSSISALLNRYAGSHSLKVGGETRIKRGQASRFPSIANMTFNNGMTANTAPSPLANTGHPWASFFIGAMEPSSAAQYAPMQYSHTEMYTLFVQDDFKVNRNLTIQFGLRYEYEGGFWDPKHRLPQRIDLTAPIPGLQAAVDPKMPQLVKDWMATSAGQKSHLYNGAFYFTEADRKRANEADKKQFMPRLGMSLRLDDKSALRVGYGRYYTPASAADGGNEPLGSMNLGAFSPTTNVTPLEDGRPLYSLSNPFPQGLTEAYGKSYGVRTNLGDAITIAQYLRRLPLSDRINVSLQREVWNRTVLDVTYFKNWVGRDTLTVNLNMADPRLGFTHKAEHGRSVPNPFYLYGTEAEMPGALRRQANISRANLLRPYPQYGDINQTFSDLGKYRNQSVTVRAQRPFANGYSFMVSYAHVTANSQVFYDDQDQYDRLLTQRPDTIPGHRIVAVGSWGIPIGRGQAFGSGLPRALDYLAGGWQLSGIYRYRSGELLNFGGMIAPDSVKVLGKTGAGAKWFDTTGFAQLPAYTRRANPMYYSNLRGPTFHNIDAVISKTFAIHEKVKPEFRLEAYNALNQMVWASPNMTVTSSAFGETNNHGTGHAGRVLRYALRFEF